EYDRRIALLPVLFERGVQRFIDQRHRIQSARLDSELGVTPGIADQVHAMRKLAAGSKVGEDHVPAQRKQSIGETVSISRLPGDVELEHWIKVPFSFTISIRENRGRARKVGKSVRRTSVANQDSSLVADRRSTARDSKQMRKETLLAFSLSP